MSSSAAETRSFITSRLCNSQIVTSNLPSLPKLHGKTTLATTKLCEQVYKSTTGHYFDATISREYKNPSIMEYNGLNDPHLKLYFYRKDIKLKLLKMGYINENSQVIVSLREYNAYRKFIENEFLKLHKPEIDRQQNEKRNPSQKRPLIAHAKDKLAEREEKRKKFFMEQEQLLKEKQLNMREQEKIEKIERKKACEEKIKEKQLNEMKREAEREQQYLLKQEKQQKDSAKRKETLQQMELSRYNRLVQLQEVKKKKLMKQLKALEKKWQEYEEHIEAVREEVKNKKALEIQTREERVKRRDTLYSLLQRTEEEKKQKFTKYNMQQTQQLKEEADRFEKHWKDARNREIEECRQKLQRKQKFWQQNVSMTATAGNKPPATTDTKDTKQTLQEKKNVDITCFKMPTNHHWSSFSSGSNGTLLVPGHKRATIDIIPVVVEEKDHSSEEVEAPTSEEDIPKTHRKVHFGVEEEKTELENN